MLMEWKPSARPASTNAHTSTGIKTVDRLLHGGIEILNPHTEAVKSRDPADS